MGIVKSVHQVTGGADGTVNLSAGTFSGEPPAHGGYVAYDDNVTTDNIRRDCSYQGSYVEDVGGGQTSLVLLFAVPPGLVAYVHKWVWS